LKSLQLYQVEVSKIWHFIWLFSRIARAVFLLKWVFWVKWWTI
jgi:hypothetical protein